ncbi:unnamed protein product [Oikopleura dioica]|uniref:Vesicular, overexpressed in cancer, prosurvival protein 1 n=1 Tax=Oikopleura dioica TaxID=34765 RepID=E4Y106_OIKDI|nr:unnamed protein product [Oikopleura dioica]
MPTLSSFNTTLVKNVTDATGELVIFCRKHDGGQTSCGSNQYCCPNGDGCCLNYVDLWWFWCIWVLIIGFSCFCAYQHHRDLAVQSQSTATARGTIYVATHAYPGPPVDGDKDQLGYCKLPKYDPQLNVHSESPPPAYRSINQVNSWTSIITDSWNSFWTSTRANLNKEKPTTSSRNESDSRENPGPSGGGTLQEDESEDEPSTYPDTVRYTVR